MPGIRNKHGRSTKYNTSTSHGKDASTRTRSKLFIMITMVLYE